MMPRFIVLCFTTLLLFSPSLTFACATLIWYIDPQSGSDSHDCHSPEQACQTWQKLQAILNQATPGTTIHVKRGTTLTPTARIDLITSGSSEAPIIIQSYGSGAIPILEGVSVPGGNMIIQCNRQSHYILRDLQFQNAKGAFMSLGCTDILLERIAIKEQCLQECLHFKYDGPDYPSARITFQNSLMHVYDRSEGIYIGTDPQQDNGKPDLTHDILIRNNAFVDGPNGETIEMKDGTYNIHILGNLIANTGGGSNGCIFSSRARHETPPGNHRIEGNTIYNCFGSEGHAIRIRNNATIAFNIIYATTRHGITLEQPSGNPTYQRTVTNNTILYATEAGIHAQGSGTSIVNNIVYYSGSGNDPTDPQFVNLASGDLRLRHSSSALLRGAYPTPIPPPH